MKKFAIFAFALILSATAFTACRRAPMDDNENTGSGNTSTSTTAPTTRPDPTTAPTTAATTPSTDGGMIDGNGKIRRPMVRRG